jgi:hypothetical protein
MERVLRGKQRPKAVLCQCGQLHFTYGSVTLHFDREEFIHFTEAVGRLGLLIKQARHTVSAIAKPVTNTDLCR